MTLTRILAITAIIATSFFAATQSFAGKAYFFQGLVANTAVGGYDAVAYFKQKKPVKGKASISYKYKGANFRFSSQENLNTFKANPAKYAPAFGGYCAWAVSKGYTAKGDPHAWSIYNGKLYLNFNKSVRSTWSRDKAGNVKKGNANWPRVIK